MALTLFHYEGMSQIEVGNAMGISDEAVELLLARARRTLKASLEERREGSAAGDGLEVAERFEEDGCRK